MKKITRDPADTAFSNYIRERDGWACRRCGKQYTQPTMGLHCSHFMSRRHEGTRFDPENCDALCYGCHSYFGTHPYEHREWQIKLKGEDVVDRLRVRANTYKKRDRKLEKIKWEAALAALKKVVK